MDSRARLFGGPSSDAPRVRAFREIPYSLSDPGALTSELRQALKGLSRRASVAVWGLRSTHQSMLLPPATPSDLEALARREAKSATGGIAAAPLADVVVAGPMRDGRRQTGYAAAAADELRARLQPLVEAGVKIESAVTPALAHASLVRARRALLPDGVVAVLSVNALATAITVVHGGVVLFARELPWGDQTERPVDALEAAGRTQFAARVAAEVKRSLVYLHQSQKADVSRVLVCGDFPDPRALTAPLMQELSLDVETLDVGDDLDLSKLPEPSDGLRSRLGAWRTALALAADAEPIPGLKVRETGAASAPSAIARRVAAAAATGALITLMGWGLLGYLATGVTARQERLKRTIGVLEPEIRRRDDERRRAAVATAREAALAAFAAQGPRLARLMEQMSLAAPADLALSAVRVEPGDATWRLVIEGQAEGSDAAAAHATFNTFLKALDASPLLGRPASPPSLRTRTSDAAGAVADAPIEEPPAEAAGPPTPVEPPRPAASGPAYIEVARDGRLYRIPLRRQAGNLEASRRAEEARRLQEAALPRQTRASLAPAAASEGDAPGRHPVSVVDFALRYEVPK